MARRTTLPPARLLVPKRSIVASVLCACGGFLLGVDTGIIGPVTVMKSFAAQFGQLPPAVHGIIVSSTLLSAAVSSFFAGRPADTLGRPRALAFGAAVFAVGAALQAGAASIAMFAVGRAIEGLGYGLYFGTQTVYICEISPPRVRGPLTAGPQFMTCLGLVAGYFICYGTTNMADSLSWHLPFAILTALSFSYVLMTLFLLPASPRWLIIHGRESEAEKTWDLLGVKHEDRRNLENEIQNDSAVTNEGSTTANESPQRLAAREKHASFLDLFSRDVRKRTILAVFMMGFLQLCGIDAVLYYAPLLFQQAGLQSAEASFLASGISGIAIVATSVPALLLADKWGRRTSTIFGGLGLTITMLLIGGLYAGSAVDASGGAARWVVIVCIYLYCVLQATTWGISIKVYAPEIQPQRTRAQATSLAYGANWLCNFFVAFICPILLAKSASGAYFLFGGCTALATIVSFLFMVETKGRSLDEIERAFGVKGERGDSVMASLGRAVIGFKTSENKRA